MVELAIKGGNPIAPQGLKTNWPIFDSSDRDAIVDVLESGSWWSLSHEPESKNGQFEEAFTKYLGTEFGITVDNGTDAIALALKACGVEAGDEVIVPAVSFVATATAVVQVNGIPVFADITPDTYQIDPRDLENRITDQTKAIIPVHYGGYPADMDEIMDIADRHHLYVIEDAAEAHGSEWKGEKVGSIGDLGTFSFQQGKPLACGEGGFVTTNSRELAGKCISFANFGRKIGGDKYEHHWMGWNMRMTEFQAALLLCQLKRLPKQTEVRHENGKYLTKKLEKVDGLSGLKPDPRITSRGYYFYLMRFDSDGFGGIGRDAFLEALKAEGIKAGQAHNHPLYKNPLFRDMAFGNTGCPISCPLHTGEVDYKSVSCPVAERVYQEEVVALGKNFLMDRSQVQLVFDAILKIRENVEELKD